MAWGSAVVIRRRVLESSGEAVSSVGTTDGEYRVGCEVGAEGGVWAAESRLDSWLAAPLFHVCPEQLVGFPCLSLSGVMWLH